MGVRYSVSCPLTNLSYGFTPLHVRYQSLIAEHARHQPLAVSSFSRYLCVPNVYQSTEIQPKLNTIYKGLFNSIKMFN
jgi:hypothetical protein